MLATDHESPESSLRTRPYQVAVRARLKTAVEYFQMVDSMVPVLTVLLLY